MWRRIRTGLLPWLFAAAVAAMCSAASASSSPWTQKAPTVFSGVVLRSASALSARRVLALSEGHAAVQRLRGGGAVELTGSALGQWVGC